eukprot:scaffold9456_cov59-Phaeocystis_antarctica.AAC.2
MMLGCMHTHLRAKANSLLLLDQNGRTALAEVFCASGLLYGHVLALCEATCRRLPAWPWVVIWTVIWAVFGAIALVAFNCTLTEKVAREEAAMEKAAMEDVIEEVVDESKGLDLGQPGALEVAIYRGGLGSDEGWTSVKTRSKKSKREKKAGRAAAAAAAARPPCDRLRQWVQQEAECEARREAALEAARLRTVLAAALVRSSKAAATQTARAAAAFKARAAAAVAAATAVAAVAAATAAEAEAIALERAMADGGKGVGEGGSSVAAGPSEASEVAAPDQYICSITAEIMTNPVSTVRAPLSPR